MLENLSEEELLKLLEKADDGLIVKEGEKILELKNLESSNEKLAKIRSAFLAFIRKTRITKGNSDCPVNSLYQFFLLGSGVYCSRQLFLNLLEEKIGGYNASLDTFKINFAPLQLAFRMEGWLDKQKRLIEEFRWLIRQRDLSCGDIFTPASVVYHCYKISKQNSLNREKLITYTEFDLLLFRFFPCRVIPGEVNRYGLNKDLTSGLNKITLKSLKLLDKRLYSMIKLETGFGVRDFRQKALNELEAEDRLKEFLAEQEERDEEEKEEQKG